MNLNKDNYEIYYIDYLDGKLSEQECLTFENFLLLNPELEIDKDLTYLQTTESEIFIDKQSLLQTNFSEDKITDTNFNDFSLAHFDQLLTDEKAKEFENYSALNNRGNEDFNKLRLEPNLNLIFSEKHTLIQREQRSIRLYLTYAAAAACAIGIYFFATRNEEFSTENNMLVRSAFNNRQINSNIGPEIKTVIMALENKNQEELKNKSQRVANEFIIRPTNDRLKNSELKSHKLTTISKDLVKYNTDLSVLPNMTIAKVDNIVNTNENKEDYSLNSMVNPIKPVTQKISTIVNEEVDFRNTKPSSDQKGFYLKIGKLEIYHKK